MPGRYAIYYAPEADGALWQRAATWLGRDAGTGAEPHAEIPGIEAETRLAVTRSARRYGFHATLKAPMTLAEGGGVHAVEKALAAFARTHEPVPIGRLVLAALDGFLALVPEHQPPELTRFAQAVVEAFEPLRAPLSPAERQRRLQSGLSERQVDLLDRFGYPYVMDEFRFHMTVTDRLGPAETDQVAAAAAEWFRPAIAAPLMLDRLSLFHEPRPDAPFARIADFALGGGAAA